MLKAAELYQQAVQVQSINSAAQQGVSVELLQARPYVIAALKDFEFDKFTAEAARHAEESITYISPTCGAVQEKSLNKMLQKDSPRFAHQFFGWLMEIAGKLNSDTPVIQQLKTLGRALLPQANAPEDTP